MRIACIGYRDWAMNIYDRLAETYDDTFLIIRSKAQYNEEVIKDFQPNLVLFYGWSWRIPEQLLKDFSCLMLHPSPLPKYRGGSPIQNQIIEGHKESMVSIFVMNNEMDAGDIVAQEYLSLDGELSEIFSRLEETGFRLTERILSNGLNPAPQDHDKATYCKRRNPEDSEITIEEFSDENSEYLYNKIRMLADPYPNAFFRTRDGRKLVFKLVEIKDDNC